MEYIELGSVPSDEECAQLGTDDYPERSRIECQVWLNQLSRTMPIPYELAFEGKVKYQIKAYQHDFGTYREVCAVARGNAALDFAYTVQAKAPCNWDEEALRELQQKLAAAGLKDKQK